VTAQPVDLLVVGAGPTGLALALQATDHGARVRVVERRADPFRPSHALIMHPRTLEVLRPLGVVDALLARGEASPRTQLHLAGRNVSVSLGDFELSDTPFPYMLLIRQADIEAVLTNALTDRGIQVERGSELLDPGSAEQPVATIARHGTAEHVRYRYLAGCDGAKSTVRIRNDIGWQGGRYQQEVVLADIEMIGVPTPDVAHLYVGRDGMLFLFRIGEHATWRIMATRPASSTPPDQAGRAVSPSVLQTLARAAGLDATVTRIGWSEVAPLEHRLATQYRRAECSSSGMPRTCTLPQAPKG
jgi:2-polyprenyl-6-methoxyphenol hydroxylase-like FAD-dependent oxidoreductase